LTPLRSATGHRKLAAMREATSSPFRCPNCGAAYQLVRVDIGSKLTDREIACIACGAPLSARDGNFARKYFFVDRNSKKRRAISPVKGS
jgi:predicted RNA-binding Zn-ribbon protein involved in translation (DUF1610 family)